MSKEVSRIKPTVRLIGTDSNVFALLGKCVSAAKKANWDKKEISAFSDEVMSGDYNNALRVMMKYFNVKIF